MTEIPVNIKTTFEPQPKRKVKEMARECQNVIVRGNALMQGVNVSKMACFVIAGVTIV
jgi:hypothetical protein